MGEFVCQHRNRYDDCKGSHKAPCPGEVETTEVLSVQSDGEAYGDEKRSRDAYLLYLFGAGGKAVSAYPRRTNVVAVLVGTVGFRRQDLSLALRASEIDPWARMVFWQTMFTAELSTTEWTAKREKSLLVAYLTLHLITGAFPSNTRMMV